MRTHHDNCKKSGNPTKAVFPTLAACADPAMISRSREGGEEQGSK
eukprot:gene4562-4782_t